MEKLDRPAVQWLEISAEQAGQRIDNFLLRVLKGVPKSRIYRLLRKGEVRVNKGAYQPEYRLTSGDQVRIPPVRVAESAVGPAGNGRSRLADAIALRRRASAGAGQTIRYGGARWQWSRVSV